MMEILHLLPAAFETLFSVYWLSACHFCTVDVNSEEKKTAATTQESCRNKGMFTLVRMWNSWLHQTTFRALFFCRWISVRPVTTSPWNSYWAQGRTTPHCCFCTNLCPCFLLFSVFDWLDFVDSGTWHLLWSEICGRLNPSSVARGQMQLQHDQEIHSKLWIKPSTRAQSWAILGYTERFITIFFFVS